MIFKLFLSFSFLTSQVFAGNARAQVEASVLGEVIQKYSKAGTFGHLMATAKSDMDPSFFQLIQKKTSQQQAHALPKITLKSASEFEIEMSGILLNVKMSDPFDGTMIVNGRAVDINMSQGAEKVWKNIERAIPKQHASFWFELLFPSAVAAGATKTATSKDAGVTEQTVQPTFNSQGSPAVPTMPAYSPTGAAPLTPQAPKPVAGPGAASQSPLGMLAGILGAIGQMFKAQQECRNVGDRSGRCEATLKKINNGEDSDDLMSEARKLASESRNETGNNKCSGSRDGLSDCMTKLKGAARRQLGEDIGSIEPLPSQQIRTSTTK